jgi:ribosomal protein L24E
MLDDADIPYPEYFVLDEERQDGSGIWVVKPDANILALTEQQCMTMLLLTGAPQLLPKSNHYNPTADWMDTFDLVWAKHFGNGYQTTSDQMWQFIIWWMRETKHPDIEFLIDLRDIQGTEYELRR